MIVKERGVPIKVVKLEALLRRLPANHGKRPLIEEELAIARAGFRGEQSIDYYLQLLPHPQNFFFHDLRLAVRDQFFQIDTLLAVPGYMLIIELKNIAGTILFEDQFQQMIRILDGKEERFPNPLLQTSRQKMLLQEWLAQHKLPKTEIDSVTVFTHNKTIIKSSSKDPRLSQKVIHIEQLPHFIMQMNQQQSTDTLMKKSQRQITSLLIKHHTPLELDILQRFQINEKELIKGILCPQCTALPMVRKRRKWHCPACLTYSRDAHLNALQDYYLLLRPTITNQQLRGFLQISCGQLAYYLLRSMNLASQGTNKGKIYTLNFNS
ncbi:nuclease-related domain-containing protein [Bacillus aerolatus]|nr:nuclease-related domain-containing protein [Bacillus aerolatus]